MAWTRCKVNGVPAKLPVRPAALPGPARSARRGRWPGAARDARGSVDPVGDRGFRPFWTVAGRDGRTGRRPGEPDGAQPARRPPYRREPTKHVLLSRRRGPRRRRVGLHRLFGRGQLPAEHLRRPDGELGGADAPRRGVGHDRRRAESDDRAVAVRRCLGSRGWRIRPRRSVCRFGAGALRHLPVRSGHRVRRAGSRLPIGDRDARLYPH